MNPGAFIERFLNLPAKLRLVLSCVAAVAVLIGVTSLALQRDTRVPLFAAPLHPEQVAETQERLAEWSVAFTATADNVLVERQRRNELLLRLSLAGVPRAHLASSSDLLSKVNALTPQSVVDEQARAGLSSDLQLALRGIEGVQDASIIVAPAKAALFADGASNDASASVRLHLRPGTRLLPGAVAGIRNFVAAGVAGLNAKRVTIVDDRGVALADDAGGGESADLQESLQSALDAAVGAGSTIVRVHVEHDGQSQVIKHVRRTAISAAPIASERTDERYVSTDKRYSKSSATFDRGSDTREVQANLSSGRISRISVAIAVDATHANDLYKIRALAAAAAGLNFARGDTVNVQAISFATRRTPTNGWAGAYGAFASIVPSILTGVFVLGALRMCLKPAMVFLTGLARRRALAQTRAAVAGFAPSQVRGALLNEPPHTAAAIISALPAATAAAVLDLYPAAERSAIVRRMSRPRSPFLPDCETLIADA